MMLIFLVLTSWTTETVMADSSLLQVPVIATDASGNPYILVSKMRGVSNGVNLYYLFLYTKNGGNWRADTFESYGANCMESKDLTIDKFNRIYAIYFQEDTLDYTRYLIVASKDSIGWSKDTVAESNMGPSFDWVSVATDTVGIPHIAYDYYLDPYTRGFYAFLDDSIWQKEIIDSLTDAYCCAIDVDSQNQPHISYFRMGDNLWYAKKIDSVWYCEEVDHTNYASWWTTSICIGPDDLSGIAYKDPNSYEVKYAYHNGISWHIDIVDSFGGAVGTQKALDIDSLGKPYFIYEGGYNDYLAYKDTGAWHKEILPLTPLVTNGCSGALRIGRDGTIHIARLATDDVYTYREIHYIYGTPEGIEEESQITNPESNIPNLEVLPNPFSKLTTIKFQVPSSKSQVTMSIYDVAGKLVRQFDYPTIRLSDQVIWQGNDNLGQKLPPGVYFCCLKVDDLITTTKITKLK